MTDTPALLPPDPSVPGRYWLRAPNGLEVIANFRCGSWLVIGQPTYYGARFIREQGYTLATPHPIPGPAALEAVWEAIASMEADRDAFRVNGQTDIYSRGKGHGLDDAIHMLRAALETKEVEA